MAEFELKPMRRDRYQKERGIEPLDYTRPIKAEDLQGTLRTKVKRNHKKGSIEITLVFTDSQLPDDLAQCTDVIVQGANLALAAIKESLEWRSKWRDENNSEDQMEIGFGEIAEPQPTAAQE